MLLMVFRRKKSNSMGKNEAVVFILFSTNILSCMSHNVLNGKISAMRGECVCVREREGGRQRERERRTPAQFSGSVQIRRAQTRAAGGEVKSLLLALFIAPPGVYNS